MFVFPFSATTTTTVTAVLDLDSPGSCCTELLHLLHVCSGTRLKLRGSDSESAVKIRAGARMHLLGVQERKPDSHQQVRSEVRCNSSASPLFRIERKLARRSGRCDLLLSSCPPSSSLATTSARLQISILRNCPTSWLLQMRRLDRQQTPDTGLE